MCRGADDPRPCTVLKHPMADLVSTPAAPKLLASFAPSSRVIWMNQAARWVISTFGLFVVLAVALILIFIGKEAIPLFAKPSSREVAPIQALLPVGVSLLTWSVDEFQSSSYGLGTDGRLYYFSNHDGHVERDLLITDLGTHAPEAAWASPAGDWIVAGTRDGKLKVISVILKLEFDAEGHRKLEPVIKESPLLEIPSAKGASIDRVVASWNPLTESLAIAVQAKDGRLWAGIYKQLGQNLELVEIHGVPTGETTALSIDNEANALLWADSTG